MHKHIVTSVCRKKSTLYFALGIVITTVNAAVGGFLKRPKV